MGSQGASPPPESATAPPPAASPWSRVLHWAVLMGGLVTIVDLGTLALQQRVASSDSFEPAAIESANLVFNALFYSMAGASVARETGRVGLAIVAGLLAGLLDGMVVGAAQAMTMSGAVTPGTGEAGAAQLMWLQIVGWNVVLGTLLASMAGLVTRLLAGRSGGPGR